MTDLTFVHQASGEIAVITISHTKITRFARLVNGIPTYTKLEGLQLNPAGIVKEFPDLEGKPLLEMRKIALERFKNHLDSLGTEQKCIDYLKLDLYKHGYKMIMIHRRGHRPIRVR